MLDDLRLYLDTHPEDADGLALLKDLLQKRRMLTEDFAQACYPLTPDCMGTVYLQNPDSSCFCWQEGRPRGKETAVVWQARITIAGRRIRLCGKEAVRNVDL